MKASGRLRNLPVSRSGCDAGFFSTAGIFSGKILLEFSGVFLEISQPKLFCRKFSGIRVEKFCFFCSGEILFIPDIPGKDARISLVRYLPCPKPQPLPLSAIVTLPYMTSSIPAGECSVIPARFRIFHKLCPLNSGGEGNEVQPDSQQDPMYQNSSRVEKSPGSPLVPPPGLTCRRRNSPAEVPPFHTPTTF
jgi:hypothetical protein